MSKTPTFWAAAVAVAITVPAAAQEPAKDHVKELIAQAMQQAGQTAPVAQACYAETETSRDCAPTATMRMSPAAPARVA